MVRGTAHLYKNGILFKVLENVELRPTMVLDRPIVNSIKASTWPMDKLPEIVPVETLRFQYNHRKHVLLDGTIIAEYDYDEM